MREVDEVAALRALRDQIAWKHGGDPMSLVRELSERSLAAGRELVRLPRREPQPLRSSDSQPTAQPPVAANPAAAAVLVQ